MIKFHTNRELSLAFSINLAKWKRWSREFLPPDPLGGLQSGYARQYNLDEAFTVFLGGHLVGVLKFTIPESRQVLHDLHQWLVDHDFYFFFPGTASHEKKSFHQAQSYRIAIISTDISNDNRAGLAYRVKATFTVESINFNGLKMSQERFIEFPVGLRDHGSAQLNTQSYRILNISALRNTFLGFLQTSPPINP